MSLSYEFVKTTIEDAGCKLISLDYKGIFKPLEIECNCGNKFTTNFKIFKDKNKHQCDVCSMKHMKEIRGFSYKQVKDIIENSPYSNGCKLISKKYDKNNAILDIQCICGEMFHTTLANFQKNGKNQCNTCGEILRRKNLEYRAYAYEYVKEYIESNTDCKLLSNKYINIDTKLSLRCECGKEYEVSFYCFKNNYQRKCSVCSGKSLGEIRIRTYLENQDINYKSQHRIDDCRHINTLPFDFVILENNSDILYLIEYQGLQHYEAIEYWGGEENLLYVQNNDRIKREYCKVNNIELIVIPYWDFENIEIILDKKLNMLSIQEVI